MALDSSTSCVVRSDASTAGWRGASARLKLDLAAIAGCHRCVLGPGYLEVHVSSMIGPGNVSRGRCGALVLESSKAAWPHMATYSSTRSAPLRGCTAALLGLPPVL